MVETRACDRYTNIAKAFKPQRSYILKEFSVDCGTSQSQALDFQRLQWMRHKNVLQNVPENSWSSEVEGTTGLSFEQEAKVQADTLMQVCRPAHRTPGTEKIIPFSLVIRKMETISIPQARDRSREHDAMVRRGWRRCDRFSGCKVHQSLKAVNHMMSHCEEKMHSIRDNRQT